MNHAAYGARGSVERPEEILGRANAWARARGGEALLMDARAVFGVDHLTSAVHHAERAKARGEMSARSLAMETLLYLSGQRQVADGILVAGIRPGTERIAILTFPAIRIEELLEDLGWVRDDSVLEAEGKSLSILGVGAREGRTVPAQRRADLALERTALLDIAK